MLISFLVVYGRETGKERMGVTFAMKCFKPDVKSYEALGFDGEM